MKKNKACEGCAHRVECLTGTADITIQTLIETFQDGDKIDEGSFYLNGCIGEVNQALEKFWNVANKLFEHLQRRINHG